MNCGRCDDRGYFSAVRYVGRRLVPQTIPCPSCQGTEADKLTIKVLTTALVSVAQSLDECPGIADSSVRHCVGDAQFTAHAALEAEPADFLAWFEGDAVLKRRPLDAGDGKSETSGDDQPDALPVVPAQPPPEEG